MKRFSELQRQIKQVRVAEQADCIFNWIRQQIDSHHLESGDKLPGIRQLSAFLKINYATVHKAYQLASDSALLESLAGRGTFVAKMRISTEQKLHYHDLINMNSPFSEHSSDCIHQLKREALVAVNQYDFKGLFSYKDTLNQSAIRQVGLQWMDKRINHHSLQRIIPCSGIHEALVALFVYYKTVGAICLPAFFYPGIKMIIHHLSIPVVTVECDEEGPLPSALEQVLQTEKVAALYLNPTINNPTTTTLSINRRLALVAIIRQYQVNIIEDDAYGALSTRGIATFSQILPEKTWYINGLSKSFSPGLRQAWICAPLGVETTPFLSVMASLNMMTNPLIHQIAINWIESGQASKALQETRNECGRRAELVKRIFTGEDYAMDNEGFHLWLNLAETNAVHMALHLQQQGIHVLPSHDFTRATSANFLRVSLGGYRRLPELAESLRKLLSMTKQTGSFSAASV